MKKGSYSKATTVNPKDLIANKKVSVTKFPLAALLHGAAAMENGAAKYGPYNWRAKDVVSSIYVDAALRHLASWFEREEYAEDSRVHHLGHALACCAILLDARENGNLIDDRPESQRSNVIRDLLETLSKNKNPQPNEGSGEQKENYPYGKPPITVEEAKAAVRDVTPAEHIDAWRAYQSEGIQGPSSGGKTYRDSFGNEWWEECADPSVPDGTGDSRS